MIFNFFWDALLAEIKNLITIKNLNPPENEEFNWKF